MNVIPFPIEREVAAIERAAIQIPEPSLLTTTGHRAIA